MTLTGWILTYLATMVAFLAVDAVWLGKIANQFYASQLGDLMRRPPLMAAAGVFYALYVIGIIYFAIKPAREADSISIAITNGALFGFFAYGTYDMTNLATIRDWPWRLVLVDWTWGTVLTAFAAFCGYWVSRLL
ncbi:MAG: DUF2177 family protein [Pseudomonadota bacterium]